MKLKLIKHGLTALTAAAALLGATVPTHAADKKPNILFIMGDDIGIMNVGAYHQGLMVGETPNIDRLAKEGARFMAAYAEQSCTAGRTAFITGMNPLRAGMIMPQLPGSTSSLLPGTPISPDFCSILATIRANSARTTWVISPLHYRRPMASRSSGATCITWMRCRV